MYFIATEYEKFVDTVSDSTLQLAFKKLPLVEFWCHIEDKYPEISQKIVRILQHFSTTDLCEAGFSSYISTEATYHKRA